MISILCWKRLSRHDEWCSIDLDESLMSVTSTATQHCSRNFANTSQDRTEKVGNTEALSNNLCRRDTSQEHPIIRIAVEMKASYGQEWTCKLEWQQLISLKWIWTYWLIMAPLNWRESFKGLSVSDGVWCPTEVVREQNGDGRVLLPSLSTLTTSASRSGVSGEMCGWGLELFS